MSWWNRKWRAGIRERFGDREDIGREAVYERYFASEELPRVQVFEVFDLIESEFGPIGGLLRPKDNLVEKFFTPVKTNNPFRGMTYEVRAGDSQLSIGDELEKQLKKYGISEYADWPRIETIEDLVRVWCSRIPRADNPSLVGQIKEGSN
jgi:hypothetical protein